MLELVVRPLARRDLKAIWAYTVRQWGEVQADQYLYDLAREMQELLKFPELGVPCNLDPSIFNIGDSTFDFGRPCLLNLPPCHAPAPAH